MFSKIFKSGLFIFLDEKPSASASESNDKEPKPNELPPINAPEERGELAHTEAEEIADTDSPAGKIHGAYFEKTKEITAETVESDRSTLKSSTIAEIRGNARILKKPSGNEPEKEQALNLKEETRRRIKAYTSDQNGDWFTLDYQPMGSDSKGLSHEMNVGVGDILVDPDIQEILVKKGNRIIRAHRGVTKDDIGMDRVCFMDRNNKYIATFSGDQFKILSNDESNFDDENSLKAYLGKSNTEATNRKTHKEEFDKYLTENERTSEPISYKKDVKEEEIDEAVIHAAEKECEKGATTTEQLFSRTNFLKIVSYVAGKVGIPAQAILAVGRIETHTCFKPTLYGDGGAALGMGQFHTPAWESVKKTPVFKEIAGKFTDADPSTIKRASSIIMDIAGIAIFLKKGAWNFGYEIDANTKLTEDQLVHMRFFYHVPGYARSLASGNPSQEAKDFFESHRDNYAKYSTYALNYENNLEKAEGLA